MDTLIMNTDKDDLEKEKLKREKKKLQIVKNWFKNPKNTLSDFILNQLWECYLEYLSFSSSNVKICQVE